MIEITGNLWDYWRKPDSIVCITTNGVVDSSGHLVMGRGNAAEAKQRWPRISSILGNHVKRNGNIPRFMQYSESGWPSHGHGCNICSFPTKNHWRDRASILLIQKSAELLLLLMEDNRGYNWILPRPGCGNGGLKWETVKPVIEFLPDNVWVISAPPVKKQVIASADERCDFCLRLGPFAAKEYEAVAKTMALLPDGTAWTDDDCIWAACPQCVVLIDGKRWDELLDRCANGVVGSNMEILVSNQAVLDEIGRTGLRERFLLMLKAVFGDEADR